MKRAGILIKPRGKRRVGHACRRRQQDHVLVVERGHARWNGPTRIGLPRLHPVFLIEDAAMAAVAIEEIEFRKCPIGAERRIGIERQRAVDRHCLADRPQADTVRAALARTIIGIFVMMLLQRRKQIDLEADARMACGHDAVRDELAAALAAQMAIKAHIGARGIVLKRNEPARDIIGVRSADCKVGRDPTRLRAVTGFAAYPVAGEKTGAGCPVGGCGMAAEAGWRCSWIAHAKRCRNLPRALAEQY